MSKLVQPRKEAPFPLNWIFWQWFSFRQKYNISRQRKYQLRHPDKLKELQSRYEQSEKGKARKTRYLAKKALQPTEKTNNE